MTFLLVTMGISCTLSEICWDTGQEWHNYRTAPVFNAPLMA